MANIRITKPANATQVILATEKIDEFRTETNYYFADENGNHIGSVYAGGNAARKFAAHFNLPLNKVTFE